MQRLMDRELKRLAKAATGAADEEEEELDLPIESYRKYVGGSSLGCNAVHMSVSPPTLTHAQPRRVPIGCQPSANLGGPRP